MTPVFPAAQTRVAPEVLLDGRLALFHEKERWLAVADLHYGFELSQRAAGWLTPVWGMASVETQLDSLLETFVPERLIIVGDLVHDRTALPDVCRLLEHLRQKTEVIVVAGNHDRHLGGAVPLVSHYETPGFHFHHGHCAAAANGRTRIIGHHHPAASLSDGAGLRLKLPAFVQEGDCWILPAFSPWAAGAAWKQTEESRVWLCSPRRILEVSRKAA